MSKIEKVTCDRCGKELFNTIGNWKSPQLLKEQTAKITLWGVGESKTGAGQRIDLCEECFNEFINFMETIQ